MKPGQVFTDNLVLLETLYNLSRKDECRRLEPCSGMGHIVDYFEKRDILFTDVIEIDKTLDKVCDREIENMDFFHLDGREWDSIITNPPYFSVKKKLYGASRTNKVNIYIYFIEKCFDCLVDGGEMIMIVPFDFLRNTRAGKVRAAMLEKGRFTDIVDFGEQKMFSKHNPFVIIFKYVKALALPMYLTSPEGTKHELKIVEDTVLPLSAPLNNYFSLDHIFNVRVGLVSGADMLFQTDHFPDYSIDMMCSDYAITKVKKRYLWTEVWDLWEDIPEDVQEYLLANEEQLRSRRGRSFKDHNWWKWSTIRNLDFQSPGMDDYCIYVNTKTRNERPFFKARRGYFSGSLLMLDPKGDEDLDSWLEILNDPKIAFENLLKNEGRFDFRQKTVKNILYR